MRLVPAAPQPHAPCPAPPGAASQAHPQPALRASIHPAPPPTCTVAGMQHGQAALVQARGGAVVAHRDVKHWEREQQYQDANDHLLAGVGG